MNVLVVIQLIFIIVYNFLLSNFMKNNIFIIKLIFIIKKKKMKKTI